MIPSVSWISLAGSSFEHPDVSLEEIAMFASCIIYLRTFNKVR
jgi:hypothetical protein